MLKKALAIALIGIASGCASAGSQSAICDGTRLDRTKHAAALAEDGGDMSVVSGARLIAKLDAACEE